MKSSRKIGRRSFSSDQSQQPPCQTFLLDRQHSARRRIVLSASLIVTEKINSVRSYGIPCTATTERAVSRTSSTVDLPPQHRAYFARLISIISATFNLSPAHQ